MRLPLPLHSYRTDATSAATSRLVNAYAEAAPQPSKAPVIARRAPGIRLLTEGFAPGTSARGLHVGMGYLWAVIGESLTRVSEAGEVTMGYVAVPGTDNVSMADNGSQLIIACDAGAYVWSNSMGIGRITDADFLGATSVAVLDDYAIFSQAGSQTFQYSAIGDAFDIDGLDFATAEGKSDPLVGHIVDRRRLFMLGTETTEIWYNSGDADNPFQRVPEGFVELGCAGKRAFTRNELGVFMLASDRTVRQWVGNGWGRISQHGVEQALGRYGTISDCKAFTYTHDGHIFVAFRFGAEGATWVYDCTTTEWHERSTPAGLYTGTTYSASSDGNWRVVDAVTRRGTTYALDGLFPRLGVMDSGVYTEWASEVFPQTRSPVVSEFTFAPVYVNNRPVYHRELEIVMETGVGTTSVSNPQIRLQYRDSEGNGQWTEAPSRSLGAEGNRRLRVRWHRLGYARDRVYRLIVSDAVKVVLVDAQLEAEIGG